MRGNFYPFISLLIFEKYLLLSFFVHPIHMPLRICILESESTEENQMIQYPTYISPYLPEHAFETHRIVLATAKEQVEALIKQNFDVFINLCDGAAGSGSAGIEVVQILERHGVAFTGADEPFYEPTRQQMKDVCKAKGINYPAYAFARSTSKLEKVCQHLKFPLIVKPASGYGSVGVLKSSKVYDFAALEVEVARILDKFPAALIEEFISGREFTVLIAENANDPQGPFVYPPIEFRFPEGEEFKHYDLKWFDYQGMSTHSVINEALVERLKHMAKGLFLGLKGRSYARCDIRMDDKGELYMLEINPNCGVFYAPKDAGSADFILLNDKKGHRGFLELLITAALKRSNNAVEANASEMTSMGLS